MMDETTEILFDKLVYSCLFEKQRGYEQFISEHTFGFQVAGETHVHHTHGTFIISENTLVLARKNQLAKTTKIPPKNGEYKIVSIILDQDTLRQYAVDNKIEVTQKYTGNATLLFKPDEFLNSYFQSLIPYINKSKKSTPKLAELKIKEAIELLLQCNPDFKGLLFDFSEPYKIDLEEFMQQNYMFNVPIENFAKLTGRSLAGFKRDFTKTFNTSPRQWLQEKRLTEAHYLIKQKKKKPADIYLDLGFEDLSHFYFSFKQKYGVTTSEV